MAIKGDYPLKLGSFIPGRNGCHSQNHPIDVKTSTRFLALKSRVMTGRKKVCLLAYKACFIKVLKSLLSPVAQR